MQLLLMDAVQNLIARRLTTLNSKKLPTKCLACSSNTTTEVLMEIEGVIVRQTYCDQCLAKRRLPGNYLTAAKFHASRCLTVTDRLSAFPSPVRPALHILRRPVRLRSWRAWSPAFVFQSWPS